jgi:hypothetical protein
MASSYKLETLLLELLCQVVVVLVIVGGGGNKLGAEYLQIVLGQGNFPRFPFCLLCSNNSAAVLTFEVERNKSILHYRMLKTFIVVNV